MCSCPGVYLAAMTRTGEHPSYALLHEFIRTFEGQGFEGIDPSHPLVQQVEEQLRARGQYMHMADLVKLQVLFRTSTCRELFGLEPEQIHMGAFFARTLPIDMPRHNLIRAKTLNAAQDLFIHKEGHVVQSAIFRQPNAADEPIPVLFQVYLFHGQPRHDTVFVIMVLTDLSGMHLPGPGQHYYLGHDLENFRFPDEELLRKGLLFSKREFEILRLIAQRLESDQIAERLFLSVNTVNTHRRNILRKAGKSSTHELVIELKEMGLL